MHFEEVTIETGEDMKETDLYEPVKNWLEEKGWEVFAEVSGWEGVADIVAKQPPTYCVVEMKTSLSHDVIDQAIRWVGYAHYIYIAIPERKTSVPRYLKKLFSEKGIGLLEVFQDQWSQKYDVKVQIPSKFKRAYLLKNRTWRLREEHKEFVPAGSSGGAHWTPYKGTMKDVKEFLKRELMLCKYKGTDGWVSIDEILNYCETHYSNPKPSLSKALCEFETDWCESKKIGRKIYFRYKENQIS